MVNFPTSLDTFTTKVDNVDTVVAAHINNVQAAIVALETKVGADSSAVTTTLDYLLRHLPAQAGNWDIGSYQLRAETLYSDVATGTAPLTITSITVCTNLNADLLDGQHGSYYQNAGNINAGTLAIAYGGTGSATQNFVDLTNIQTVAGVKTFSSIPEGPASDPTTSNQFARKAYVDSKVTAIGAPVSKTAGTIYQALTDGFIVGNTYTASQGNGFAVITDSAASPTYVAQRAQVIWSSGGQPTYLPIMYPIKKNEYYKVLGYDYQGNNDNSQIQVLKFIPSGT